LSEPSKRKTATAIHAIAVVARVTTHYSGSSSTGISINNISSARTSLLLLLQTYTGDALLSDGTSDTITAVTALTTAAKATMLEYADTDNSSSDITNSSINSYYARVCIP
jgi:hypothetical protein